MIRAFRASLLLGVAAALPMCAQSASPPWTFTVTVGGFARGTGHVLSRWLDRNGYGISQQPCGYDLLLNRVCSSATQYPQSKASVVGAMASIRSSLPRSVSLEVFVSTEQSGTVTGRCDVTATPRDPRCTDAFVVVNFGGASFASVVERSFGKMHVGVGPALLLANWELKPAHLAGLWLDASYDIFESRPFLLRAQYRAYRSTTRSPARGFDAVHPSTLLLGLGYAVRGTD